MKMPRRTPAALCAVAVLAAGLATVALPVGTAAAEDAGATRDGLVAEYLFGEQSGTAVHNTADGSTDGTDAMDATVVQGSDVLWGDGSLGFTGGAKNTGSWVRLPQGILAGDQTATVSTELWADPAMLRGFHFLWNVGNDATASYFFASLNCTGGRRTLLGIKSAGTERLVQAPSCATTAERWTNLTVSVDGATDTASIYVDGELVTTGAMPYSPADVVDQTLNAIGRAPWPDPLFKGRVGAFRVYDRALAASEVAALSAEDAVEHAAALQAEADALVAGLEDRSVDGDFTVPTGGGTLTWTSSDPAVVTADGDVTLPPLGSEPVVVQLTARADVRGQVAEQTIDVTVLPTPAADTPYGYLMVHFIEDSQGYAEKIYLDVSRDDDPTHWLPLNDGKPILASNLGTTGIRDPHLTYNPETGTYYIIATDLRVFGGDNAGWGEWSRRGSRYLNIWESKDLINWGEPRQLLVSPPTAGMSWAPEATWVPSLGKFVVYWSSTLFAEADTNHNGATYSRIVYGTTTDFETDFAYQGVMLDSGADVIDTTVVQDAGTTYRITKDNGSGRGIFMQSTTAADWWLPTTTWTQLQTNIGQADYGSVEGPAVFKDHDRDHWYLYVDVIPSIGYRPYETSDLDIGWSRIDTATTGFEMTPSTKHGGIISLTKGQYDEVRAADVDHLVTQEVALTTPEDVAPILPGTTEVVLEDGDEATVAVTWDDIDPAAYAEPGDFTVDGVVQAIGNNLNESAGAGVPLTSSTAIDNVVRATVTVIEADGPVVPDPVVPDPVVPDPVVPDPVVPDPVVPDPVVIGPVTPTPDPVTPVPGAPRATTAPLFSGKAMVGRPLTVSTGTWDVPGVTTSVQWLASGVPVAGATGTSYVVGTSDVGKRLSAVVTATKPSYPDGMATAFATAAVAKAATRTRMTPQRKSPAIGKRVRLTLATLATGVTPTGKVKVYDGARLVRTVLLKKGRATLRLLLPSLGRHTLRADYRGSPWAAPSSTSITVHIVRKP